MSKLITKQGEVLYDPDTISKDVIAHTINNTKNYKVKSMSCCNINTSHYDVIIIGGGSSAFAAAIECNTQGKTTLLINGGLPIGGTCVNIGCVPSKFLIRAAETIFHGSHSHFDGISFSKPEVNFQKIIQQKKRLVAELQQKKYIDLLDDLEMVRVIEGMATFSDEKTILVNGKDEYTAEKIIIATGTTIHIPPIAGLKEASYLTNATLFDMEEKTESLTILGAGYIGLEIACAYNRLGVKIRIVEFTDRAIRNQMSDISEEIQQHLINEGIEFYPNYRIDKVERVGSRIIIHGKNVKNNSPFEFIETGHIVVATGTTPNTKLLGLEKIGVATLPLGHILVNEFLQTSVPHIFAIGDCNQNPPYVYTAAYEGKIAAINCAACCIDEFKRVDYNGLPWVIFTDPQVAGVGMDEAECEKKNIPYEVSKIALSEVPRAITAMDTRGFIKLIRHPETDQLLGARIIAPEGGELVMELSLAIKYGITTSELAESLHPYLTLSEGIKLAAIGFRKNVATLSCCAAK